MAKKFPTIRSLQAEVRKLEKERAQLLRAIGDHVATRAKYYRENRKLREALQYYAADVGSYGIPAREALKSRQLEQVERDDG